METISEIAPQRSNPMLTNVCKFGVCEPIAHTNANCDERKKRDKEQECQTALTVKSDPLMRLRALLWLRGSRQVKFANQNALSRTAKRSVGWRGKNRLQKSEGLRSPNSPPKQGGEKMEAINASQLANHMLCTMNQTLADKFDADVMLIKSGMMTPLDGQFRIEVETIQSEDGKRKSKLLLILETPGGYIETVKRLVDVMRRHYKHVSFVVPNYAYSAGTVLALSGDEIWMDYYSILGPIDPQMADDNAGTLLPGAGYLAKFEELVEEINVARLTDPKAKQAELAYLIKRFEPAKLFHIEQAIEHGQALIEEWLPKYKFKSWAKTSSGKKVTPKMRRDRAKEVAAVLGDAKKWHSHGRGISMPELEGEDIKLKIQDFGKDKELSAHIRNYHGLAVDFGEKQGLQAFIHSNRGMRRVS